MTVGYVWIAIALIAAATIVTRCVFFLLGQAVKLPPKLQRALRYAPAVALAAIVMPDLVLANGAPYLSLLNAKLMAGVIATGFFVLTRHMLGTIIVGMGLYTVLRIAL